MIGNISIGQYFPNNSVIHKMDPRVKFVLTFVYIIYVFICNSLVSLLATSLLLLIIILFSKIKLSLILKSIKPVILIIVITSLLQIFYNVKGSELLSFWKIKITSGGLYFAAFTTIRIISLVIASSMLTFTTTPTRLSDAMESVFSPLKIFKINVHSIAMMMTIALRFIPTIIEEVDKITSAQKARGADFESGGLVKRAKAMTPIFVPLFVNSFKRAYDLAFAMECRCYKGGEGRTKFNIMKIKQTDVFAIVVFIIMLPIIIILNKYFPTVI